MKRSILLILMCCTVLMASTSYRDTIPDKKIQEKAQQMTDEKLESLSSDKYMNRLVIGFADLRNLIDSLYAESIKKQESIELASQARDSVTRALLVVLTENASLRAENKRHERDWNTVSSSLDWIFFALAVYIASLLAQGTYNGYKEWKQTREK